MAEDEPQWENVELENLMTSLTSLQGVLGKRRGRKKGSTMEAGPTKEDAEDSVRDALKEINNHPFNIAASYPGRHGIDGDALGPARRLRTALDALSKDPGMKEATRQSLDSLIEALDPDHPLLEDSDEGESQEGESQEEEEQPGEETAEESGKTRVLRTKTHLNLNEESMADIAWGGLGDFFAEDDRDLRADLKDDDFDFNAEVENFDFSAEVGKDQVEGGEGEGGEGEGGEGEE